MNKRTKKFKIGTHITGLLSFLLSWGVLITFLVIGFATGNTSQSFALGITGIAGALIGFCGIIARKHWLSPLIVLMFGLYLVLDYFTPVLITIGLTIMLDELVVSPLHKYFKSRYIINKEIDKREN